MSSGNKSPTTFSLLFLLSTCHFSFFINSLFKCGDIELNPGTNDKCHILYHNIRGLKTNLPNQLIALRDYDVIMFSETWYLTSDMYLN